MVGTGVAGALAVSDAVAELAVVVVAVAVPFLSMARARYASKV